MRFLACVIVLTLTCYANNILAETADRSLLLRLDRLERMMQSQLQSSALNKVKQLQQENQSLRSQLERQVYEHEKLKKRLHSLYQDMDRRIQSMEKTSSPVASSVVDTSKLQTAREDAKSINLNDNVEEKYQEQKKYRQALNELNASHYAKAEISFLQFLKDYPQSSSADLAQYWLSEANYAQHNYKQALSGYLLLLKNYPSSSKRAEAQLKAANCYYELHDNKNAKKVALALIKQYPKSTESKQAKQLLKRLK